MAFSTSLDRARARRLDKSRRIIVEHGARKDSGDASSTVVRAQRRHQCVLVRVVQSTRHRRARCARRRRGRVIDGGARDGDLGRVVQSTRQLPDASPPSKTLAKTAGRVINCSLKVTAQSARDGGIDAPSGASCGLPAAVSSSPFRRRRLSRTCRRRTQRTRSYGGASLLWRVRVRALDVLRGIERAPAAHARRRAH
ncbi:hypothetical protein AURDEDRAFT_175061 [Auricularia subglabra TFB-10046 SS5]|nr:hypothetical protein AURDEDRAFT_175061 [Auricularia subglabra TFB-10046 SS5]